MAAQRYRGEHSPDAKGSEPYIESPKPQKMRLRQGRGKPGGFALTLLFLAPFPLLLSGVSKIMAAAPIGAAIAIGTYALFVLAAWTLREGIKAETAYNERKIARAPMFPRKLIAAGLSGGAVFLAAWLGWGQNMFTGIGLGGLAVAAHIVAFGFDPMRRKGLPGFNEYETDRVARAVEKAEAIIEDIRKAAALINNRAIERKVDSLISSAQEMLRTVEEDPRDLTGARKYLTVYLMGARDATIKFADIYARNRDPKARADYAALLDDLEQNFAARTSKMLLDDRSDLTVEIDVLRERLQREGVRPT